MTTKWQREPIGFRFKPVMILLAALLIFGCGGAGQNSSNGGTGAIGFRLHLASDTAKSGIDCQNAGIDRVMAEVSDADGNLVAQGGPWGCDEHSGTIQEVPQGSGYVVEISCTDNAGSLKYKGHVTGVIVTAGQTTNLGEVALQGAISIDAAYLQYRTYSDESKNGYRGWIEISAFGEPVQEADVSKITLKDADGRVIETASVSFDSQSYVSVSQYSGTTDEFDYTESGYSGFSLSWPDETQFPQGYYTYTVTTGDGASDEQTLYFPGKIEMPIADSTQMTYEWQPDGSLVLSWENPGSTYDLMRLVLWENSYFHHQDLLYANLKPETTQLTIPAQWVGTIQQQMKMFRVGWQLQTRMIADENMDEYMNYARGYSNSVPVSWPDTDAHFDVTDYFPLDQGRYWIYDAGYEYRKRVVDGIETIDGISTSKVYGYDGPDLDDLTRVDHYNNFYADTGGLYLYGEYEFDDTNADVRITDAVDGQCLLAVGGTVTQDSSLSNNIHFPDSDRISVIKASLMLTSYRFDNDTLWEMVQGVSGHFYQGPEGFVQAGVGLKITPNGEIVPGWRMHMNGELIDSGDFSAAVDLNTWHTFELAFDKVQNRFFFTMDNTLQYADGPENLGETDDSIKYIGLGFNGEPSSGKGYIEGRFDDVYINDQTAVYDDFKAEMIDTSKWDWREVGRTVYSPYMKIKSDLYGGETATSTYTVLDPNGDQRQERMLFTIVGHMDVPVMAGTFSDCILVEIQTDSDNHIEHRAWARGVGEIGAIETDPDGNFNDWMELVDYGVEVYSSSQSR